MYREPKHEKSLGLGKTALIFAVLALLCADISSNANAQSTNGFAPASSDQILVLKNGEILTGRIEHAQAKLIVHTRQGSRLVIPKSKADFICDSVEQAFWGKSARIRASDTRSQIELFRWCLKHGQLDLADSQLEILMQCDVPAALMVSLNRQLNAFRKSQMQLAQKNTQIASAANPTLQQSTLPTRQPQLDPTPNNQASQLFQPLPELNSAKSNKTITNRTQNNTSPTISTDGKVIPASFVSPVTSNKPKSTPAATPRLLKPISPSFSTAGPIPDLSTTQKLTLQESEVVDPYDAAAFNAETARRMAERK